MTCQIIHLDIIRVVKRVLRGRELPALINPASLTLVVDADGSIQVGVEAFAKLEQKWVRVEWPVGPMTSLGLALDIKRATEAKAASIRPEALSGMQPANDASRRPRVPRWTTCRAAADGRPCATREDGGCVRRFEHRGPHRAADGSEWSESSSALGSEAISGEQRSGGQDSEGASGVSLGSGNPRSTHTIVPNCDR